MKAYLQSSAKYIQNSKNMKRNWTRPNNFVFVFA